MRRGAFSLEALLEAHIREAPRTIRDLRTFVESRSVAAVPRIERALQRLKQQHRVHLLGRLWAHPNVRACGGCAGRGWVAESAPGGVVCAVCGGAGWIKSELAEGPANVDESK